MVSVKEIPGAMGLSRDQLLEVYYKLLLSRMMLDCIRELSPRVEYYSIDEFFFEAVPLNGLSYQGTAEAIPCPRCGGEWHARVKGDDVVPLPLEEVTEQFA